MQYQPTITLDNKSLIAPAYPKPEPIAKPPYNADSNISIAKHVPVKVEPYRTGSFAAPSSMTKKLEAPGLPVAGQMTYTLPPNPYCPPLPYIQPKRLPEQIYPPQTFNPYPAMFPYDPTLPQTHIIPMSQTPNLSAVTAAEQIKKKAANEMAKLMTQAGEDVTLAQSTLDDELEYELIPRYKVLLLIYVIATRKTSLRSMN